MKNFRFCKITSFLLQEFLFLIQILLILFRFFKQKRIKYFLFPFKRIIPNFKNHYRRKLKLFGVSFKQVVLNEIKLY